ncbi:uncharacterized protein LOC143360407 [Halictus rubicundus]|uniref:uncharacterized protein LOC143360407 n=1 Tax=Halictus rubicundus TaxID=77578 RepID=UPI004035D438
MGRHFGQCFCGYFIRTLGPTAGNAATCGEQRRLPTGIVQVQGSRDRQPRSLRWIRSGWQGRLSGRQRRTSDDIHAPGSIHLLSDRSCFVWPRLRPGRISWRLC